MKYLNIIAVVFFLVLSSGIVSSASDAARDNEITMLRQKIAELENRVKEMEAILAKYHDQDKALDESGYGWQNKKNWRKLEKGMSAEEVMAILGTPIKTIEGVKTLWYYPDIYRGVVSFDDKGILTGWRAP